MLGKRRLAAGYDVSEPSMRPFQSVTTLANCASLCPQHLFRITVCITMHVSPCSSTQPNGCYPGRAGHHYAKHQSYGPSASRNLAGGVAAGGYL